MFLWYFEKVNDEAKPISQIESLLKMGYKASPQSSDGVRYLDSKPEGISYPRGVLGTSVVEVAKEGSSFWLDSRANYVLNLLFQNNVKALWDIGAGDGAMTNRLGRRGIEVISVEPLIEGAKAIASEGAPVFNSTLEELKLPDESIENIGLFDVLEHLEDPTALLFEVHRVLKPNGMVFITVPAHKLLWSSHDEALGHFRRYSKKTLRNSIELTDLTVMSINYIFPSLVPISFLSRTLPYRLGKGRDTKLVIQKSSKNLSLSKKIDRTMYKVLGVEQLFSKYLTMPFGLSLILSAKKSTTATKSRSN
jgi:ubiquinone/menaquinone biosynthesis C-methylase UbiE